MVIKDVPETEECSKESAIVQKKVQPNKQKQNMKNKQKGGNKKNTTTKSSEKLPTSANINKQKTSTPIVESYRSCTGTLYSEQTSIDVKIGGFTQSAWSNEQISDANLEFTIGRRYGQIGSNASGKSTLQKCIASREIPIPNHIDIEFLENEAPSTDLTALEWQSKEVKNEISRLEELSNQLCEEYGPESELITQIYDDLDKLESRNPEVYGSMLLTGLGFDTKMMSKATKDMSGGWRMRIALAKVQYIRPTLLLLDEPTNHLDLETCVWQEKHLSTYEKCLIVNSHSQDFLNGVCTHIIEQDRKKQIYWTGNYDTYVRTKKELEINQLKKYEKEQADIKHIKEFIASCGTFSNLVRQAKSKQKILDKMYAAGQTEKPTPPPSFNFRFSPCIKQSPPVLQFSKVGFSYNGDINSQLYKDVDLAVDSNSRIAIVGPNGTGKSTLLKLMLGEQQPTLGEIKRHLDLRLGRYNQHVTSEQNDEETPQEYIQKRFKSMNREEDTWRGVLGRYGISGKVQKIRIGCMSDGQKCRLMFCILSVMNPNLLLLDEPTNHLDMECIDALAEAIHHFDGGVVIVSHDFRLLSQIAKQIIVVDGGTVKRFSGDIRDYKNKLAEKIST